MTRSELIQQLASRHPELTQKDIEMAVRLILDKIASVLEEKGRVEIRGFGAFGVFHRLSRKGRNPNTGKIIELPAKDVPHFRAGKELRERVNHAYAVSRSDACPETEPEAMEA
ncbi:integration host factor subunit beta [mine drainage metagenome]|uniref:Integration host factor subunit beta n=1 Tax=mine drainage metagenome TaxID=410659 RepID=A0A1J5RY98_9ZZZZ